MQVLNVDNQTASIQPEGNTHPAKWDMYVHKPLGKATLAHTDKENEKLCEVMGMGGSNPTHMMYVTL